MSFTSNLTNRDGAKIKYDVHPYIFFISAGLIIFLVALTIYLGKDIKDFFGIVQTGISTYTGWFFVLTMNLILICTLLFMFSRFGDIRLGGDEAVPEFSTPAWFAMLFSAGMGIGLLFYGVAEPMFHFISSPFSTAPGSPDAARMAMDLTFLHWGLHPWSVYAIVGLSLAFFSFNKGYPLTIRSAFVPLLGDKVDGPLGYAVDISATVATLFGVATSLGVGVQQVNAGLFHVFGIPQTTNVQLILICAITLMATYSVVSGLDAGIRRLSELNISLALLLMCFVLLLGPTLFILNALVENIGIYFQNFMQLSTWNETYENTSWQDGWTVFYWGWWIGWSPFVGMFIARISKGRTIREFIAGVLLVPTLVTFVWITVFGNSALFIDMFGGGGIAKAVQENVPVSLFVLLEHFPFSSVTSVLGIIVVISFFVTSSDSGSLVIDIITANGNQDPPVPQRVFWAMLEGTVAAALLYGGGLIALQTATIASGLPFAVILLFMMYSLFKGLKDYSGPQQFYIDTDKKPKKMSVTPKPFPAKRRRHKIR
ncbi:BCCT family transporter [Halodesulfovibrio marinisediminis]|uniref:Choline/glycine/proline betaine transport protein n=1 Tax=Halodesulfovibrio marinisediminis DSM 17456 TaxID=1121457 RepID=A0A1N6F426_9BACT|nr:BCCT family transporter [Halodesulfovibrio marinisediminis]SIN89966.1 choline/glycine/proline betaine transport protein [Halodesulfovibrio marinisediminis DSM 17456]